MFLLQKEPPLTRYGPRQHAEVDSTQTTAQKKRSTDAPRLKACYAFGVPFLSTPTARKSQRCRQSSGNQCFGQKSRKQGKLWLWPKMEAAAALFAGGHAPLRQRSDPAPLPREGPCRPAPSSTSWQGELIGVLLGQIDGSGTRFNHQVNQKSPSIVRPKQPKRTPMGELPSSGLAAWC